MADNVQLNAPTTSGATIATDDIAGVQHQLVKVEFGADGVATPVSAANPLPVIQTGTPALPTGAATAANQQTDALTDAQLRAVAVPISGTVSTGGLTDVQLRESRVPMQSADQFGFTVDATPNSEMLITNKIKLVGEIFDGAVIDTNFWTTAVSVGTATEVASELVLTSGTASPNFARIYTPQRANWVSGTTNKFRTQMRIASSDDDVTCRFGVGWGASMPTITDGAYFKIVGSTISVNTMAATVETSVASGSFNGTYVAPTLTNLNVFEILYTLRTVTFLINNIIVHRATYNTANWTSGTNNFHAFADVNNTGASAAIPYTFRMINITRLGNMLSMPTYKRIAGEVTTTFKLGGGLLHSIVVNKAGTLCTVYDDTAGSGTIIGIIDTNKNTGTNGSISYECPFYKGLTLVTTGAGTDITVIYE